ncbi:MAG TPA: GNAT family N-acetyltransferase [Acidobacteriota bacterium]|nr:GNAT family N-acetyltransferase [Acidobacteriota bacterium]
MIRPFGAGDASPCSDLIHACIMQDQQLSAELRSRLLRQESPEIMIQRAGSFYIAVFDSTEGVVGVGGIEMNEIRLLYVAPEHQDTGIGGALLAHLLAMVPPALFSDIFVYSTLAAVDFYKKHGFASAGEFGFDCDGEQLTTVFMTKAIR